MVRPTSVEVQVLVRISPRYKLMAAEVRSPPIDSLVPAGDEAGMGWDRTACGSKLRLRDVCCRRTDTQPRLLLLRCYDFQPCTMIASIFPYQRSDDFMKRSFVHARLLHLSLVGCVCFLVCEPALSWSADRTEEEIRVPRKATKNGLLIRICRRYHQKGTAPLPLVVIIHRQPMT